MVDACQVTGYTRDQMRGMLRDLPPFVKGHSEGRNKTFSRIDLLTISVITLMEERYGVKRSAIAQFVQQLGAALSAPRLIDPRARLKVIAEPPQVTFLTEDLPVSEGLIIPLGPIFKTIDHYLGAHSDTDGQGELPLGPVIMRTQIN